jgi:D-alanine--poly(phosphoribitol) ligase subunit 2
MKEFIQEQVKDLVFRSVGYDEPLLTTKLLDSIAVVDLAVALEARYGIAIPFTDISERNFDSINLIACYLETKGVPASIR